MKKNLSIYMLTLFLMATSLLITSCNGFLDNMPKGKKIPTTFTDFEALLRDEYTNQREDVTQALVLLNDRYVSSSYLSYYPLYNANYFWNTSANRVQLNNSDEGTYYDAYAAISNWNLILENVNTATDGTDSERKVLTAQCRILRAMDYFMLVNFYSKTYNEKTADTDGGVPLITSAAVGASYTQPSVKAIYDFILNDIKEALPDLPQKSATILHPNLGTGYAFAARVYLQMSDYADALAYANQALSCNDSLFNWPAFYNKNKAVLSNATTYQTINSPMGYDYVENYDFRHGSVIYVTTENNLRVDRAAKFETGDAEFMSRWKVRTVGASTYYNSNLSGRFNRGGMTTVEVYLIKAECLARTGHVSDAMAVLNTVRKSRILPEDYVDLTATTEQEAINYIRTTKDNALILTLMPFADARRYNLETDYARTLSKAENGTNYSLAPDSYMWVMPFPAGAVNNSGNGKITQNVDK